MDFGFIQAAAPASAVPLVEPQAASETFNAASAAAFDAALAATLGTTGADTRPVVGLSNVPAVGKSAWLLTSMFAANLNVPAAPEAVAGDGEAAPVEGELVDEGMVADADAPADAAVPADIAFIPAIIPAIVAAPAAAPQPTLPVTLPNGGNAAGDVQSAPGDAQPATGDAQPATDVARASAQPTSNGPGARPVIHREPMTIGARDGRATARQAVDAALVNANTLATDAGTADAVAAIPGAEATVAEVSGNPTMRSAAGLAPAGRTELLHNVAAAAQVSAQPAAASTPAPELVTADVTVAVPSAAAPAAVGNESARPQTVESAVAMSAGVPSRSARQDSSMTGQDQSNGGHGRQSPEFLRFAAALAQVSPAAVEDGGRAPVTVVSASPTAAPSAPVAATAAPVPTPATPAATPAPENVGRLVEAMRVIARPGAWEANVRLNPEHLGEVSIAVRVERNSVSAVVNAEAAGVRQWLESQEQAVRDGMAEHGLQLDRFIVHRDGQRREAETHQQQEAPRHRGRRPAAPTSERFEIVV